MTKYGIGEVVDLETGSAVSLFAEIVTSLRERNLKPAELQDLTNEGNALLKSEAFQSAYRTVLASAAAHMGEINIYAQRQPTFRIQPPGAKSVSFHTDDISSGHGADIANFWVALSDVNALNGLHLVPHEKSSELLSDFRREKWSLNDLDARARSVAEPVPLTAGQAICFSNRVLHGTVVNASEDFRASLDFRCLPKGADLGTRVLGHEFFEFPLNSIEDFMNHRAATSVIFQSGLVSHVGHQAQREVIRDFAARRGFQITRETSEWHHLDHYPIMEELLSQSDSRPVLCFAQASFDWETGKGERLRSLIAESEVEVYFCLENEIAERTG